MSTPFFEPLETRRLMSTTLVNGVLTVVGTDAPDVVRIEAGKNNTLLVDENGAKHLFNTSAVTAIRVDGRGGPDRVELAANVTRRATLIGGAGNDTLIGGAREDHLDGGAGDDSLDGGNGADFIAGGPGADTVDYATRTANLNVSLDDVANDGAANERDDVRSDVERVRTGAGNDRVIGSAANNVMHTGDGADTVYGHGGFDQIFTGKSTNDRGPDLVYGGDGDDFIRSYYSILTAHGEAGRDTVIGGPHADTITGGAGNDTLEGGAGHDRIDGGDDDDSVRGGAGNDTIRGGAGRDSIHGHEGDDTIWGESEPSFFKLSVGGALEGKRLRTSAITTVVAKPLSSAIFSSGLITSRLGAKSTTTIGGGLIGATSPISGIGRIIAALANSDTIDGGAGNDTVRGGDGADEISGGDGHDRLYGDDGADLLRGDNGNDQLFGGADDDRLHGGWGEDLLVSIGGGTDRLFGEGNGDQFWKDAGSQETTDADWFERMVGSVHDVAAFANGASRELNGQNLTDPDAYDLRDPMMLGDDYNPAWKNFAAMPLFGPRGISAADVRQGRLNDGYLLTALSGVAKQDPYRIRRSIADLGDGTYAVQFLASDGTPRVYRVDADLPLAADQTPYYAGLGDGGATWAPLMEKAFALHRGRGGTYRSLGGGSVDEAFAALGMRRTESPPFILRNGVQSMRYMTDALKRGEVILVSTTDKPIKGGAPLLSNHTYVVEHVTWQRVWHRGGGPNGGGYWADRPMALVLRNVWGADGAGNDGSDDGLVTITDAHFEANLVGGWSWK